MSLLHVEELSHTYLDKILYENTSFDVFKGEHVGVVGQNGVGKSTLIKILTDEVISDKGIIKWGNHIKIGHLDQYAQINKDQTIEQYLHDLYHELYELEKSLIKMYEKIAIKEDEKVLKKISRIQEELIQSDFYQLDVKINKVVYGLGINAIGVDKKISDLSGGQRAKVILAKLLLEEPDVLLLDEPTNFLDKEHVDWLINFLTSFKGTFLVVSHDIEFLDKITDTILDIDMRKIKKYHGKYTDFLKQKEQLREEYVKNYKVQQKKIEKAEKFIQKNIAGTKSKSAKSRRKQLEKMERLEPPTFNKAHSFLFKEVPFLGNRSLEISNLTVGYDEPLIKNLNLKLNGMEKIVITGFNGIGKTTLLKTLVGEIQALKGDYRFHPQIKIGYFEQEFVWEDKTKTPIQLISDHYPTLNQKQIRSLLATVLLKDNQVVQKLEDLSGGEQSKVKLCLLLQESYNFLILDEPTNHLDKETKKELQNSLKQFEGNIILVSHEASFYEDWIDRIINVEDLLK